MDERLNVKPLRDHLTGLRNKMDRRDDKGKIAQSITACIQNILFETERLDLEAGYGD